MKRRFEPILDAALVACEVPESLARQLPERFRELVTPFGDLLASDSERYYFYAILEGLAAKRNRDGNMLLCVTVRAGRLRSM